MKVKFEWLRGQRSVQHPEDIRVNEYTPRECTSACSSYISVTEKGRVFFFPFGFYVVFNQSQGLGWGRGSGGVEEDPGMRGQGGTQGSFPYPSRDGGERGEDFVLTLSRVEFLLKTESGYLRDAEVT